MIVIQFPFITSYPGRPQFYLSPLRSKMCTPGSRTFALSVPFAMLHVESTILIEKQPRNHTYEPETTSPGCGSICTQRKKASRKKKRDTSKRGHGISKQKRQQDGQGTKMTRPYLYVLESVFLAPREEKGKVNHEGVPRSSTRSPSKLYSRTSPSSLPLAMRLSLSPTHVTGPT